MKTSTTCPRAYTTTTNTPCIGYTARCCRSLSASTTDHTPIREELRRFSSSQIRELRRAGTFVVCGCFRNLLNERTSEQENEQENERTNERTNALNAPAAEPRASTHYPRHTPPTQLNHLQASQGCECWRRRRRSPYLDCHRRLEQLAQILTSQHACIRADTTQRGNTAATQQFRFSQGRTDRTEHTSNANQSAQPNARTETRR